MAIDDNESTSEHKLGPLSYGQWALVGGAGILLVILLPRLLGMFSGLASGLSGGGSGGATTTGNLTQPSGTGTTTALPTVSSWLTEAQAAASQLGGSVSGIQTAITDYLAGAAVPSSDKTGLNAVLAVVGQAPGIGSPTYSTSSSTPSPTPSPSPSPSPSPTPSASAGPAQQYVTQLLNQMSSNVSKGLTAPGEHYFTDLVSTGAGALGLTNDGGVYFAGNGLNSSGSQVPLQDYGSLFTNGVNGSNAAVGASIAYNHATNGYTITMANGTKYTYGPGGIVG